MAYTPINWQTGDVITAEKLNKMDNGWGVENAELFSETTTTEQEGDFAVGSFAYSEIINSSTLSVTFGGTEYNCERIDVERGGIQMHNYGGSTSEGAPDFSEYPFMISSGGTDGNALLTPSAGTYSVSVTGLQVVVSDNFKKAVNVGEGGGVTPLLCVSGETTAQELEDADTSKRMMYFYYDGVYSFITGLGYTPRGELVGANFIPEDSSISVVIQNGIFTIVQS